MTIKNVLIEFTDGSTQEYDTVDELGIFAPLFLEVVGGGRVTLFSLDKVSSYSFDDEVKEKPSETTDGNIIKLQ